MLSIDILLTEDDLAGQFFAALERRELPEKFFYWFPLSVRAWLDLCRDAQPYKNFSRSRELVSRHAASIARQLDAAEVEVVSLGAGQGDKDFLLLEALQGARKLASYRPVDSSQALLELACQSARAAGFPACGLKADLEDPVTHDELRSSAGVARLYVLLGNNLGAFDPPVFAATLKTLLRPQDRLLADGEIFDPAGTMAGYDNPVNRRFAFAPLASLGLEEPRDGALVFETGDDARRDGLHFVTKYFRFDRALELPVAGRSLRFAAGERLRMSRSAKYSPAAWRSLFSNGLRSLDEFTSADGGFLMELVALAS